MNTSELKQLPLAAIHEAAGARFGPFAGWSMPLTYPPGVLKEHMHTREHAGLFDISHMQLVRIEGKDAATLLERVCPLEADEIAIGQSKYTFLLNGSAGIIDDLIVTRLAESRFMVVANAGNATRDLEHIGSAAADRDCAVTPLDRVLLALQGPEAATVLKKSGIFEPDQLVFMTGAEPREDWFVSRSGYTGEDGFEMAMPVEEAARAAETLLADGRCQWIGLAARDSLRLEAGLCLHGQDIDESTTPVEAGLLWAIPKSLRENGNFIGAGALRKAIETGPVRRRVGIAPVGRQPVRSGVKLFDADDKPAGDITSGGYGPSAGRPVAMGYVESKYAQPETELYAEVRGNRLPVLVHKLPFVSHRYLRG